MTQRSDTEGEERGPDSSGQQSAEIVISGLDEPEGPRSEVVNPSPTDEAIGRLQRLRARGEPEDEDG
ncbi:hypothetical protein Q0M94_01360 [Deinococcus radiomollis]|uniref:hypothetical protein n=1 Tax=Deinococcus radiomollis TaxID=468916 RepID=UPI003891ECD9